MIYFLYNAIVFKLFYIFLIVILIKNNKKWFNFTLKSNLFLE